MKQPHKKHWIKRIGIVTSIVVFVIAIASMTGVMLFRGEPTWYQPNRGTAEERHIAATAAESKFKTITNWANAQRAVEDAKRAGATAPGTSPSGELSVSFTERELNAFLEKWSVMYNWRDAYGGVLDDPVVVLQDNRIILAGKMKELGAVLSVHLAPTIDESGKLHLDLASVQAGRLPLPGSFWAPRRDNLLRRLQMHLPEWRRRAAIAENGSTNSPAMSAAFTAMLLDASRNQPTEPVLFLPLMDKDRTVPVTLTSITIEAGTIKLTAQPMTVEQRAGLLERIRTGTRDASVAAK